MTTRDEWLLLGLAHLRGRAMTPTQVQKAMFLMRMEADAFIEADFYTFKPYNYGPFDSQIYNDLDRLVAGDLVARVPSGFGRWSYFAVTAAGQDLADRVRDKADPKGVEYLGRVVDWVSSLSFQELVRSIYAKYPQFKANSVFVG